MPTFFHSFPENFEFSEAGWWQRIKHYFCMKIMRKNILPCSHIHLLPQEVQQWCRDRISTCCKCRCKDHIFHPGFPCSIERSHQYSKKYNKHLQQIFAEIGKGALGINLSFYTYCCNTSFKVERRILWYFFILGLKEVCSYYARVRVIWIKL